MLRAAVREIEAEINHLAGNIETLEVGNSTRGLRVTGG